jgi:hypothetical protein
MAMLVILGLSFTPMVNAQTQANADAMYNGYLNTYLYTSGSTNYFTNSITNRSDNFEWTQAYEITGVEDAYDRNMSQARQTLISNLLNTFITVNFTDKNSTNLSWDTWNDDSAWSTIALARGYQITGNTTYLTDAENVWNMAYNRGWDSTFGGGIWENQNKNSKCVLSNLSFVPSGIILYQATGDSSYLTKVEAIYAWTRANLFHTSNGAVNECVKTTGVDTSTNAFNNGLFLNADAYLYRLTGNIEYYNDAILAASFQINAYPIMSVDWPKNGPFGPDQFWRGLSNFARWNGLWSNYSTWFQNNATEAWNNRNTTYNITWDTIATQTPGPDILSMETESAMVLEQVAEVEDVVAPPVFSGNYELENAKSGLALTISGGSKSNDAAVVQEPFVSGNNAYLWTITPVSGGYYNIVNVNSGLAMNVSGASAKSKALIVQNPTQSMLTGNDKWMPILNSDGTYSFYNLNSQLALDDTHASTADGIQYQQYIANYTPGQEFHVIAH